LASSSTRRCGGFSLGATIRVINLDLNNGTK
jgi:hypothetical protein